MIHEVGRWIFEQAVCTCVRLRAYDPNFYLTFNVSLQQLSDPLLMPEMAKILQKYGLCGGGLVAELTESCLDENRKSCWILWTPARISACASRWTTSAAAIRPCGCCSNIRPASSSWTGPW